MTGAIIPAVRPAIMPAVLAADALQLAGKVVLLDGTLIAWIGDSLLMQFPAVATHNLNSQAAAHWYSNGALDYVNPTARAALGIAVGGTDAKELKDGQSGVVQLDANNALQATVDAYVLLVLANDINGPSYTYNLTTAVNTHFDYAVDTLEATGKPTLVVLPIPGGSQATLSGHPTSYAAGVAQSYTLVDANLAERASNVRKIDWRNLFEDETTDGLWSATAEATWGWSDGIHWPFAAQLESGKRIAKMFKATRDGPFAWARGTPVNDNPYLKASELRQLAFAANPYNSAIDYQPRTDGETDERFADVEMNPATQEIAAHASGTLTFSGIPVADQTIVVGANTYTFKAVSGGTKEITIGATAAITATNTAQKVTAEAACDAYADGEVVNIVATSPGTGGNSVILTSSATNVTASAGGTLTGGDGKVTYACIGENRVLVQHYYASSETRTKLAVRAVDCGAFKLVEVRPRHAANLMKSTPAEVAAAVNAHDDAKNWVTATASGTDSSFSAGTSPPRAEIRTPLDVADASSPTASEEVRGIIELLPHPTDGWAGLAFLEMQLRKGSAPASTIGSVLHSFCTAPWPEPVNGKMIFGTPWISNSGGHTNFSIRLFGLWWGTLRIARVMIQKR